jgi:phosphate uptake regulator
MHEDAINALSIKNAELAQEVKERDDEVDRLHWLVGRQTHIALRDIILSQKMGVTLAEANQFQFFSKFLERIGDHAVKIAKNALKIIDHEIANNLIEKLKEASQYSLQLLRNSLDAWLQKDITLANENIEKVKGLIKMCEEISIDPKIYNIESSIAIGYIIESIRRTGEYSGDISELIINNLVRE